MRVTLHIGSEKTGSTSIQSFLRMNSAALLARGILYPASLGKVSHIAVPVYVQGMAFGNDLEKKFNIGSDAHYASVAQDIFEGFAQEVNSVAWNHLIISSEHLHPRCNSPEAFQRLRSLLSAVPHPADVTVVIYLRAQLQQALSLYSTWLRNGYAETVDTFLQDQLANHRFRYDYRQVLELWLEHMSPQRCIVRSYAEANHSPSGVVSDFVSCIDSSLVQQDLKYPQRLNRGIGRWGAEFLQKLNIRGVGDRARALPPILKWLREVDRSPPVAPSVDASLAFQNEFRQSNAWVAERFFSGSEAPFSVDFDALDGPGDSAFLNTDTLARLVKYLSDLPPDSNYPDTFPKQS